MISRQTARNARISDLVRGKWVKKEGMVPSFVISSLGENISRTRITGTVVARFDSEDGNYSSVTLDDGTETIRLKAFKDVTILENLKEGRTVEVTGKVREYNEEIYIIPEVIKEVTDPNFELLRRLEVIRKVKGMKRAKEMVSGQRSKFANKEELRRHLMDQGLESYWIDNYLENDGSGGGEGSPENEKRNLRKEIIEIIEAEKEGIVYSRLMESVKAKEADIESVVNELLSEGVCYEPTPGKIRKI